MAFRNLGLPIKCPVENRIFPSDVVNLQILYQPSALTATTLWMVPPFGRSTDLLFLDTASGPALGPTVKRPRREDDQLPPPSTEVNKWNYNSTSQYISTEWLLNTSLPLTCFRGRNDIVKVEYTRLVSERKRGWSVVNCLERQDGVSMKELRPQHLALRTG